LLITIVISIVIVTVGQVFYVTPRIDSQQEAARIAAEAAAEQQPATPAEVPEAPAQPGGAVPGTEPGAAAPAARRIAIDPPSVRGSLNTAGARLDELILKQYRVTVEPNSPNIELLSPATSGRGSFAELGYVGNEATGEVPGRDTVWQVEGEPTLTPDSPITLTYTNDRGLTFTRRISVDADYLFTIEDSVTNTSGQAVSLAAYGRATRSGPPETT